MLTIGQLAKRSGVRTSTLCYYESEVLLLPSERTDAGYWLYQAAEQTLRFIQRAQRLGFALDDIRRLLQRIDDGRLRQEEVIYLAEGRYLEIEKPITHLLVLRHEMGLFLQDMRQHNRDSQSPAVHDEEAWANTLFAQLVERVCADPGAQAAANLLKWLLSTTTPFNYRVFAMPLSDAVQQRQTSHSMCQDFLATVLG